MSHNCLKEGEIADIHRMCKDMHKALFGNGQPGLVAKFNNYEGMLSTFKWLIGSSGLALIISIVSIIKTFV